MHRLFRSVGGFLPVVFTIVSVLLLLLLVIVRSDLQGAQQALASNEADSLALQEANRKLTTNLEAVAADRDNFRNAFGDASARNKILAAENLTLDQDLHRARTDLKRTEMELGQSTKQVQSLRAERDSFERDYRLLSEAGESYEHLAAEVKRLEHRLAPLMLQEQTITQSGFQCTGSMEPTITCLDEAEWRGKFSPAEIKPGMVITFIPDCEEGGLDSRATSHRVVKVKVEAGTHYYWTRGDGNREDDGCWTPESQVNGILIALHEDAHPENERLRQNVLIARESYHSAMDAWAPAHEQYVAILQHHCGAQPVDGCVLHEPAYSTVMQEYERVESLRVAAVKAEERYNCWLGRAHWGSSLRFPPPVNTACY